MHMLHFIQVIKNQHNKKDLKMTQILNDSMWCEIKYELNKSRTQNDKNYELLDHLKNEIVALECMFNRVDKDLTQEEIFRQMICICTESIRLASEGDSHYKSYDPESGYRGDHWNGYKKY